MPLRFTAPMQKRAAQRTIVRLHRALLHFPELQGRTITVGYTRAHLGAAIPEDFIIRLRARKVSYNTIGHELMHLVQGLRLIPEGEKPCDIWTLARNFLFCDEAPAYLTIPLEVRSQWSAYAGRVHELCVQAIAVRESYRNYISWLEKELQTLTS